MDSNDKKEIMDKKEITRYNRKIYMRAYRKKIKEKNNELNKKNNVTK
tara:strand:- start:1000 stop:1140 length:141 start_codon:yes stop_codon:yes gene_type:complete